jgi:hypothetical protein
MTPQIRNALSMGAIIFVGLCGLGWRFGFRHFLGIAIGGGLAAAVNELRKKEAP